MKCEFIDADDLVNDILNTQSHIFLPYACRSEMGPMHCLIFFSTIIWELFVSFLPATWHSVLVVQMMLAYWNLWLNSLMNMWCSCSETVYCSTAFLVVNLSIILTSISTQCSIWSYSLNWTLGYDLVLGFSHLFVCWLHLSCSFLWFLIRRSKFLVVQLIVYIFGNANIPSIEELGHQYGLIKVTFFFLTISKFH
jgi:hypothetical protein